jgi:uncharacterized protein (DUF433 family)
MEARMRDPADIGRIVQTPGVLGGKPRLAGTRVAVETVLGYLHGGMTVEELLEQFERLHPADIEACLEFAADSARREHRQ